MRYDPRSPLPARPPTAAPLTGPVDAHVEHGALGATTVVPDDYRGPMPLGGVRASDYQRMIAVYGNIEAGTSPIQIDTSSFFKDAQGADIGLLSQPLEYLQGVLSAAQFRTQYMGYLGNLARTPAGIQLLEQLDGSKYATTITRGSSNGAFARERDEYDRGFVQPDGSLGKGMDRVISMNPDEHTWDPSAESCATNRVEPWMENRPELGFYHELVHAYHFDRGDSAISDGRVGSVCAEVPTDIMESELQAVGLGEWATEPVSENAIRAQLGAPLRPTYGGSHYDDPPANHDVVVP